MDLIELIDLPCFTKQTNTMNEETPEAIAPGKLVRLVKVILLKYRLKCQL